MSKILVVNEKHGTFYWDASTDEALAQSALKILTDRWNEGYWYHDPDKGDVGTQQWRPEALIENILGDTWPGWEVPENERVAVINAYSNSLKEKYGDDPEVLELKSKRLKGAIREYKERREYREWYAQAKEIVASQTPTLDAWYLLRDRSDYEYEQVELETLQT